MPRTKQKINLTKEEIRNRNRRNRSFKKKPKKEGKCQWCGTTETPEWRRGPKNGPEKDLLCNACGIQYRLKLQAEKEERGKMNITNFIDPIKDSGSPSLNENSDSSIQNRSEFLPEQEFEEFDTLNPVATQWDPEILSSDSSVLSSIHKGFSWDPAVFFANPESFIKQIEIFLLNLKGLLSGATTLSSNLETFSSNPVTSPSNTEFLSGEGTAASPETYEGFSSRSAAFTSNAEVFSNKPAAFPFNPVTFPLKEGILRPAVPTRPTDTHCQNTLSTVKNPQSISVPSNSSVYSPSKKENTFNDTSAKPGLSSVSPYVEKNLFFTSSVTAPFPVSEAVTETFPAPETSMETFSVTKTSPATGTPPVIMEPHVKHHNIDPFRQAYSSNSYFQKPPSSQFFTNSEPMDTNKSTNESTNVTWDFSKFRQGKS